MASLLLSALLLAHAFAAPTVTLPQYGTIIGKTATLSSQPSITALAEKFYGIPFAEVPTGTRRFVTPTLRASPYPNRVLSATKSAPTACLQYFAPDGLYPGSRNRTIQLFNNPFSSTTLTEKEDCLYLNVFRPLGTTSNSRLPVMIWVFGGNLAFGSDGLDFYDGSSFAYHQNVIIVTFNYRTNIFGFSNSPQIPAPFQNAGLFDQRLAINFVSNNIAAFGGDKNKITLFGQSAGGWSIKQMLALNSSAPAAPNNPVPRVWNAIIESQGLDASGDDTANWSNVSNRLCPSRTDVLNCMQQLNATAIQTYITTNGLSFGPKFDNRTATGNVYSQLVNGNFADTNVNIMLGSNRDEAAVFEYIDGNRAADAPTYHEENALTSIIYFCHADFLCYNLDVGAQARKKSNDYKIYEYQYSGNFSQLQPYPNALAYHTAEIPVVFGTWPGATVNGASRIAILSRRMQAQWAYFAANARVNTNLAPNWTQYTQGRRNIHIFDGSNTSNPDYDQLYAQNYLNDAGNDGGIPGTGPYCDTGPNALYLTGA